MTCNYFDFERMTDKLFYGVTLSNEHLNKTVEEVRKYLVDGGAASVMDKLGIGIRIVECDGKIIEERMVYLSGDNKGRILTTNEICNIKLFLNGGVNAI